MMLSTIQIPEKYFPIFYLEKTDACGRALILNSYALDFYKHGSIKAIVSDNGYLFIYKNIFMSFEAAWCV